MLLFTKSLVSASLALTCLLAALIALTHTALATDAGEIAFENNRDGNWEIYLLDLRTGITHNLTRSPSDDFTPAWSPDGSRIAFVSNRDDDHNPEVYIMDSNGDHVSRLRTDAGVYATPTWTADGSALVVMRGWQQIYRVEIESKTLAWLGLGFAPRLSSDSQSMLYYANRTGELNTGIYLVNLLDKRVQDLTAGQSSSWGAAWSPDGQQIVFVSSRTGRPSIYVMNADGSNAHLISAAGYDVTPSWSPDGRQIVYASGKQGEMRLFIIDADGTNRRPLTNFGGDSRTPSWRPQTSNG